MVLPQDQPQASQASNIVAEREYQARLAQYNKEREEYEKKQKEKGLPTNENVTINVVRDKKTGKILKVYSAPRGIGGQPDEVAIKYGGVSQEQLNKLKQNPNYAGVPLQPDYTVNVIAAPRESDYYKTEKREYEQARKTYSANIAKLEGEIKSAPGSVYLDGDFTRYNKRLEARSQNVSYGGGDSKFVDWSRMTPEQIKAEQKAQEERAKLYAPREYTHDNRYVPPPDSGIVIPGQKPTHMTRAEQTAYNKQIIAAQLPFINSKFANKQEVTPNQVSPYLGAQYWTVGDKKFNRKEDAERYAQKQTVKKDGSYIGYSPDGSPYQGPVISGYTVDGKTFKTREHAEKYIARTSKGVITPLSLTEFAKSQGPQEIWEVQTSEGKKQFATEEEATNFIKQEEAKKPLIDPNFGSPLLAKGEAQSIWEHFDDRARINKKFAELNPKDLDWQIAAGASSVASGLFNMVTTLGDASEKYILKKEPIEKRQITVPTTFETAAWDNAFEGVETVPQLLVRIDPRKENNAYSRFGEGASKQWEKQTWQQNLGQSIALAPIAAFDAVTIIPGIIKGGTKIGTKILTKTVLKGTIKNTKPNAILGAPASVTTKPAVVTQWGKTYGVDTLEKNPFGKERRIPYAIQQTIPTAVKKGVQAIKNVNIPVPYAVSRAATDIGVGIKYAKYIIGQNIPKIPSISQGVKDVGIKLQLFKQDLITKRDIIKRQTLSSFDRDSKIGVFAEKTQSNIKPIIRGIGVVKDKTQIGLTNIKEFGENIATKSRLQYGGVKIAAQIFKRDQSIAFKLRKADAIEKLSIVKKSLDVPNTTIYKNKPRTNIMDRYEKFKAPSLPQGIKDAKYKLQLGVQRVRAVGEDINRYDKFIGGKITTTVKIGLDKTKTKIKTGLGDTKKGILDVLPEEYSIQPRKPIVDNKSANELNKITRGETWSDIFPSAWVKPVKRIKDAFGYSTRKQFSEVSEIFGVQKERFGFLGSKVPPTTKGMDAMGKFPDVKSKWIGGRATISAEDQRIIDNIFARNLARSQGKTTLPKDKWVDPVAYLGEKNPLGQFVSPEVIPRTTITVKSDPSKLNIRKGALPGERMSKTNVPIFGKGRSQKIQPRTWNRWGKWAIEQETKKLGIGKWYANTIMKLDTITDTKINTKAFEPMGRNPWYKVKQEPTPIGKESEEAFQRVARVFREPYKQPTTKETNYVKRIEKLLKNEIMTSSKEYLPFKSIEKAKISAKQFDNPVTKLSDIRKSRKIENKIIMGMTEMFKETKKFKASTKKDKIIDKFDAVEKHDLNKITQRAKERREMLQDESFFKYKGSRELAIGDKKGVLSPEKTKPIFGFLKKVNIKKGSKVIEERKKSRSDIWGEQEKATTGGGTKESGGLTLIVKEEGGLQPPKTKKKATPGSPKPQSIDPQVPSPTVSRERRSKMKIIPPIVKIDRKKRKVMPTTSEYTPEYVRAERPGVMTVAKSDVKLAQSPKLSEKIAQSPKLDVSITPKLKQVQRQPQILSQPAPQAPRATQIHPHVFKGKAPQRLRTATPTPKIPRQRKAVVALPPIISEGEKKKGKSKRKKSEDFLGNTKLDNIVGLFRRTEIITGDKKTNRQILKDRKVKGFRI